MSLYTVTIEPSDPSGAPAGSTQAVVRVDTGAPKPRIIEMTLQSSAASGLSATLPIIDLNGVVEALQSGMAPPDMAKTAKVSTRRAGSAALVEHTHPGLADGKIRKSAKANANRADRRGGGRVYRRMPDAKELGAAYERIGTVTGVAEHYGVPRHTAQGWMKRLRKLGATANVSPPRKQRS